MGLIFIFGNLTQQPQRNPIDQTIFRDFSMVSQMVRVIALPTVVSMMVLAEMTPLCPNFRAMV